jgi:hypothetical protein
MRRNNPGRVENLNLGPKSEETRRRMSEGAKRAWAVRHERAATDAALIKAAKIIIDSKGAKG